MSIQMSEFQHVNGGDDHLLPLYVQKNQELKIINRRTIFLYSLGLFIFCIITIYVNNFTHSTSLIKSQLHDDDLYYRLK